MNFDTSTYSSPFSWRYGSSEMRHIFSEDYKFSLWRKIWVALAEVQNKAGLITKAELYDLQKHQNTIDIQRISEIERQTKHDIVAAIHEFAEKAKIGGGKIHIGATSMDIHDNGDIIRFRDALICIEHKLILLLKQIIDKAETYADIPCMGYTHLQPAEPTTVGYRFAFYAQDLLSDYELLQFVKTHLKGKGFKGAVGTSASYTSALQGAKMSSQRMEELVMKKIGIEPALITTQVYSRKVDFLILTALASISSSVAKISGDFRILQSPNYGEWSESFGGSQIGSSAMPFKKNPITSENICSLARYVSTLPSVALQNASHSYLERTLDDSANRRIIMPEGFLATDQILESAAKNLKGMVIHTKRILHNMNQYAPFAASEVIMITAVKRGADRQIIHEKLRIMAMQAWQAVQEGKPNPMDKLLRESKDIQKYISQNEIKSLLDIRDHIGDVSARVKSLSKMIKKTIKI